MQSAPPPGSCSVCVHPQRGAIDAQLITGTALRAVDAWTAVEGNGPRIPFTTLGRHKKHLPIPAESLKPGEGLPPGEKVAAIKAAKAKVHAEQAKVTRQNPVFHGVVAETADDLAALKEAQDFCLRTLRGHAKYEEPKNEPSHPTVRLLAVAVAGIRVTAKTRFEILTGKGKPGEGQAVAGTISEGLVGLIGGAFDEEPPPMEGNTPGGVDLTGATWSMPTGPASPAAQPASTQAPPEAPAPAPPPRVPTSTELWNDLAPTAAVPPAPVSETHGSAPAQPPAEPPAPADSPRRDYGKLLTFLPRLKAQ